LIRQKSLDITKGGEKMEPKLKQHDKIREPGFDWDKTTVVLGILSIVLAFVAILITLSILIVLAIWIKSVVGI